MVALDDALETLEGHDPRRCQNVEWSFFRGLAEEEVAEVLKLSPRTLQRELSRATLSPPRAQERQSGVESEER